MGARLLKFNGKLLKMNGSLVAFDPDAIGSVNVTVTTYRGGPSDPGPSFTHTLAWSYSDSDPAQPLWLWTSGSDYLRIFVEKDPTETVWIPPNWVGHPAGLYLRVEGLWHYGGYPWSFNDGYLVLTSSVSYIKGRTCVCFATIGAFHYISSVSVA